MPVTTLFGRISSSFIPGFRTINGQDLRDLALALVGAKSSVVAVVGGTQATATPLDLGFNEVDTSTGTNSDAVLLPYALPGSSVYINNATANTITVLGKAYNSLTGVGDTIAAHATVAPAATATGVTQATAIVGRYDCFVLGVWKQSLSA